MNQKNIEELEAIAPTLIEFFKLAETEREWLLPMMTPNIKSAVKLLKVIEFKPKTYKELADFTGLHHNTVRQKLLALKRGGFPIGISGNSSVFSTGRKRVLARLLT